MKYFKNLRRILFSPEAFFIYLMVALIIPNVVLAVTEPLTPVEKAVNVLLPFGLYGLLAALSRKIGRTVWLMFPLIFLAAFQIVLLGLYGRSVIAVDMFLNLSTTNPGEAGELLGSIWPSVVLVAVLYVPALVIGTLLWIRRTRLPERFLYIWRYASSTTLALGVAGILICIHTDADYKTRDDVYPFNAVYNISLARKHNSKLKHHDSMAQNFYFRPVKTHPDSVQEVYVMVIGETSRADHWQINGYSRHTTPGLTRRKDVYTFGRAFSESNTTHKSVPLLMSHLNASTYGDSIYSVKSVLTLFKEAGFYTAFISNQKHNGSFIDMFGQEADSTLFIKEPDGLGHPEASDLELLGIVDGLISGHAKKQLIVLHTYGSHFSYRDRYPRKMARFLPDDYSEASSSQREKLINAYDNTICVTDSLITGLITRLEKSGVPLSALIYTSDHGEDIYDDDRGLFLHASPCPSYYQVHVPFLVWLSNGYKASNPGAVYALTVNRHKRISSSESFFDTSADLAGLITGRSSLPASVVKTSYHETPRRYLNDHNRSVALRESGFTINDITLLDHIDGIVRDHNYAEK